ncbi:MAG TPA: lysophospholipid acyltransferase family protein [Streptosporangiaceae bacterium]
MVFVSVLRPLLFLLMKREWRGRENVPRDGGAILAANHVTELDSLSMAHFVYKCDRWPAFLIKDGVFKVPVLGSLLMKVGQIPTARGGADAAKSLKYAEEGLEKGASIVIFPEGTCTRDPELWPMLAKTGVARMALTTGKPVIPIAHFGAHRILAYRSKRLHLFPRKLVRMVAGPPVDLSAYDGKPLTAANLRDATAEIMAAITALLATIRDGEPPAEPYDPRKARKQQAEGDGESGRRSA